MPKNAICPLCHHSEIIPYHQDKKRDYLNCLTCDLVFVPSAFHLNSIDEKAYYDLHENDLHDPAYRQFLDRLFSPLQQLLVDNSKGLDFGCGPGPALAKMFEEVDHSVALYDPHYAPDQTVLTDRYDFITLSEVAEHLAQPGEELDALWACLKPGGWLGIMTKRVRDAEAFKTWHYITDPTHISYFSETTFQWLSTRWSENTPATLTIVSDDVVLIQKSI